MIIKLEEVIHCSSQHPEYPASNLLHYRLDKPWKCAKPGEMLATAIFQLAEPSCITGLDIANYRSCVVIVTASTSAEPDNWIPIVNHQFMTHDEAERGKFTDQVQLFTKRELNQLTLPIKFDRVKVTCMQSSNLKVLFGLTFILLRTEVPIELGTGVFSRFKLKRPEKEDDKESWELAVAKLKKNKLEYKKEIIAQAEKDAQSCCIVKPSSDDYDPLKKFSKKTLKELSEHPPILESGKVGNNPAKHLSNDKNESKNIKGTKDTNDVADIKNTKDIKNIKDIKSIDDKPILRTPFGDVIPSTSCQSNEMENNSRKKRTLSPDENIPEEIKKKKQCFKCGSQSGDKVCKICGKLPTPLPEKPDPVNIKKKKPLEAKKSGKPFDKLMDDVTFSLSGYVNPQRDQIRRKALKMGARYIANPNAQNTCTHLICAFQKTPKYQQLKGISKIVSHKFIEDCFDKKKRFPWRRYALDKSDRNDPESEEEIVGNEPARASSVFEACTDSDSN